MNLVTTKQKILKYLDFKGIKVAEFYRQTGIKRGFLDRDKLKASASDTHIAKMLRVYEDLSIDWLILDIGDMLKPENILSPNLSPNVSPNDEKKSNLLAYEKENVSTQSLNSIDNTNNDNFEALSNQLATILKQMIDSKMNQYTSTVEKIEAIIAYNLLKDRLTTEGMGVDEENEVESKEVSKRN